MGSGNIEDAMARLEKRAEQVRALLEYAPRPFVMEFAGTPKSGKSTSVEALRHFFSRHGFRVHILAERAAVCPIPMKGHLFFNTWCATSMLAELLENVDTETDIIVVDRGLFDALVWLTLQEGRGELTAEEARTIEAFVLLERWRTLIDLAVVMEVDAEEALARENSQHITRKGGSIMNLEVLAAITGSVGEAIRRYGPKFQAVVRHQTTGQNIRDSNIALAAQVLDCVERFLNPEVLVVPRREIERLPLTRGATFGAQAIESVFECVSAYGRFMPRAEAESLEGYVQIVPCGILSHRGEVFVFQRKESDPKYRLYGKSTLWEGCHVSKREGLGLPDVLKTALLERVSRSLFLSRVFPIQALGYCWDRDDAKSSRHLGIVYRIDIDNPNTATDLRKKEFRRGRVTD